MLREKALFDTDQMNGSRGHKDNLDHIGQGTSYRGGRIEKVTARQLRCLIERQGYQCGLTGRKLTPNTASVDHIIPLSDGGDHAIYNLQILHRLVNAAKGTMTQSSFIAMCREVVEWNDLCEDKITS